MKAVILAAGEGTRLRPITYTTPKPLIKVAGKPILVRVFDQLQGVVDEIILIVGYKAQQIKDYFGDNFNGIKITYVIQEKQLGTGDAMALTEYYVEGRFLVMYGDNLCHKSDIENCLKYELSALATEVKEPEKYGVFITKDSKIINVIEKSKKPVSNLANAGVYVFDMEIFDELRKVTRSVRGEFELTDALKSLCKRRPVYCVKVEKYWLPIGYKEELDRADKFLQNYKEDL